MLFLLNLLFINAPVINILPDSEVWYGPRDCKLFKYFQVGPDNPFKTEQQKANKNTLTGFVEPSHVDKFQFEMQRRTFHSYGYAVDPSVGSVDDSGTIIGDRTKAEESKGNVHFTLIIFHSTCCFKLCNNYLLRWVELPSVNLSAPQCIPPAVLLCRNLPTEFGVDTSFCRSL